MGAFPRRCPPKIFSRKFPSDIKHTGSKGLFFFGPLPLIIFLSNWPKDFFFDFFPLGFSSKTSRNIFSENLLPIKYTQHVNTVLHQDRPKICRAIPKIHHIMLKIGAALNDF